MSQKNNFFFSRLWSMQKISLWMRSQACVKSPRFRVQIWPKIQVKIPKYVFIYFDFRDQSLKAEQCKKSNKGPVLEGRSLSTSAGGNKEQKPEMDSCCGDDIFRYPFATNGGQRACCGTRTYSTEILECCSQECRQILSTFC